MQPGMRRDSEGLTGLNGVSWQWPANGSSDPNDGRNLDYCPRLNPLTSHHSECGQSTLLKPKPPVTLSTGTGLAGEGVSEVPLWVEDPESVGEIGPCTPTSLFMRWMRNGQQHYHRAVVEIWPCAVADQVFTTNTIFLDGQSQEMDSVARVRLHSSNSNRNYHLACCYYPRTSAQIKGAVWTPDAF